MSQGRGTSNSLRLKLLEVGKDFRNPLPSSTEKLLHLLHKLFLCLNEVEQDPPQSIHSALSLLMKAIVSDRLLKHSDANVKVAVAACIVDIMRITAPDPPYSDDKMKELLQLIVSSFEDLADFCSPSYTKRTWILNTLARCRVCVVMLDLECDALIIEMFQHFLKALRVHHPMKVSVDMENIMTLVFEESEDIPPEMLSPILQYVKKDDEVPQVSRTLAEQVLSRCASKLKMYLTEAVKSSGISLDEYSNVVASICKGMSKPDDIFAHQKVDKQKARVSGVPERRQHSISSQPGKENGREAVSLRRETVVKTEREDPVEIETQTYKRARVESSSLHEAHGEIEKTAASEGEPSSSTLKSNSEPGDSQNKKLPQPCSVTHQLAKVKQSIVDSLTSVRNFRSELETKEQGFVDTIASIKQFRAELETKEQGFVDTLTSVRQFKSEIKKKEDDLEASLQEVDVLREKILGINKLLNS